jgi:uncharacterized membrane protein
MARFTRLADEASRILVLRLPSDHANLDLFRFDRGVSYAVGENRMDNTFANSIDQWHDFYVMAGTAGATLVGLLFVSVSLHADLITDPAATGVLATARRAFSNFIVVILISLIFLIPEQSPHGLGIPLVIFGLFAVMGTASVVRVLQREKPRLVDLLGSAGAIGRLSMGLVSSLGLLILAGTILSGSTDYLDWLVGVIGVLLIGAADSSWSLLLDLAMAKRRIADRKSGPAASTAPE